MSHKGDLDLEDELHRSSSSWSGAFGGGLLTENWTRTNDLAKIHQQ